MREHNFLDAIEHVLKEKEGEGEGEGKGGGGKGGREGRRGREREISFSGLGIPTATLAGWGLLTPAIDLESCHK